MPVFIDPSCKWLPTGEVVCGQNKKNDKEHFANLLGYANACEIAPYTMNDGYGCGSFGSLGNFSSATKDDKFRAPHNAIHKCKCSHQHHEKHHEKHHTSKHDDKITYEKPHENEHEGKKDAIVLEAPRKLLTPKLEKKDVSKTQITTPPTASASVISPIEQQKSSITSTISSPSLWDDYSKKTKSFLADNAVTHIFTQNHKPSFEKILRIVLFVVTGVAAICIVFVLVKLFKGAHQPNPQVPTYTFASSQLQPQTIPSSSSPPFVSTPTMI